MLDVARHTWRSLPGNMRSFTWDDGRTPKNPKDRWGGAFTGSGHWNLRAVTLMPQDQVWESALVLPQQPPWATPLNEIMFAWPGFSGPGEGHRVAFQADALWHGSGT